MIKEYNYSNEISKEDQNKAIRFVDDLIRRGEWCKSFPKFQTFSYLHQFEEFELFSNTFILSCRQYLEFDCFYEISKMWCFRDNVFNNIKKNQLELWHHHNKCGKKSISGLYYLRNFREEGTEFINFKIRPKPFTWYIYPSDLLHKPPKIKSFRNRYTLAANLHYS